MINAILPDKLAVFAVGSTLVYYNTVVTAYRRNGT